jgi:lipopolysaccharide transport system ATP-binding protein
MPRTAIKLTNIGKQYTLRSKKAFLPGNIYGRKTEEKFWAIKNINLTLKQGDKLSITGNNGAGKTTLLKTIAGITKPTTGKIVTNGKIVALLNLEAGFHPELSGEENILLNGMLAGMNKEEILGKREEIANFAGIGRFISAPFYTYSSGMKYRLAFSIAMASNCDILIIDEIFVYGDIEFQKSAIDAIKKAQKEKNITTIISSISPYYTFELSNIFLEFDQKVLIQRSKKGILAAIKKEEEEEEKIYSNT